jgi:TolA-binding protein
MLPGLSERDLAYLKLELADVYVLAGLIWDASMLYGQVEKRFKYDEIGFEAKLKNAKVFYYSGDFGWAEAQLDVLKGSTSKLISNDALELSIFISENTGLDSTTEALSIFSRSELMLAQHKYDSALFLLQLIESNFPGHELADNILYQRGAIAVEVGELEKAVDLFLQVQKEYPSDILADNALMEAGRILEVALDEKNRAMEIYQQVLTDYPGSLFVIEARKRFRSLRGDFVP